MNDRTRPPWTPERALATAAGVVIIALTGAAFWLSYAHLADVAGQHGLSASPDRQWAWPATLDLFIVAGELLMLRAALLHRVDPWAVGLTVAGSGGSIALNVAGVGTAAGTLDYVVAAVPPTAALLAFGALMRQVHQALSGRSEVTTEAPVPVTIERAPEPAPVAPRPVIALPAAPLLWDDYATSKVTTAVAAETPRQVVTEVVTLTPADLRRDARRMHRQVVTSGGRGVTIEQLRTAFNLSRREAADLRRQVVTEVTA